MQKQQEWYDHRWKEGLELYEDYLKRNEIDCELEESLNLDTAVYIVADRLGLHTFIKKA